MRNACREYEVCVDFPWRDFFFGNFAGFVATKAVISLQNSGRSVAESCSFTLWPTKKLACDLLFCYLFSIHSIVWQETTPTSNRTHDLPNDDASRFDALTKNCERHSGILSKTFAKPENCSNNSCQS